MTGILFSVFTSIITTMLVVIWSCRKCIGRKCMRKQIKNVASKCGQFVDRHEEAFIGGGMGMSVSAYLTRRYMPHLMMAVPQLRMLYTGYIIVGTSMQLIGVSRVIYRDREAIKDNTKRLAKGVKRISSAPFKRLRKRFQSKRNA